MENNDEKFFLECTCVCGANTEFVEYDDSKKDVKIPLKSKTTLDALNEATCLFKDLVEGREIEVESYDPGSICPGDWNYENGFLTSTGDTRIAL